MMDILTTDIQKTDNVRMIDNNMHNLSAIWILNVIDISHLILYPAHGPA